MSFFFWREGKETLFPLSLCSVPGTLQMKLTKDRLTGKKKAYEFYLMLIHSCSMGGLHKKEMKKPKVVIRPESLHTIISKSNRL